MHNLVISISMVRHIYSVSIEVSVSVNGENPILSSNTKSNHHAAK